MLKKLQRRFVLIAMSALAVLLLVQLTAVNVANIYQRDQELCRTLEMISYNDGYLPKGFNDMLDSHIDDFLRPFSPDIFERGKRRSTTRYFAVQLNQNDIIRVSTENIDSVDDEMARQIAAYVYNTEVPGYGLIGTYRYHYTQDGEVSLIVFVDAEREFEAAAMLIMISIMVGAITFVAVLFPVILFCKMAVRPVAQAIEKQKQFITDAGHELKTPLAIISADAEVIELCDGESEWLTSIKNQTNRMSVLIKNLVNLSKLDELSTTTKKEKFDISTTVREAAEAFATKAKHDGKNLSVTVTEGINYYGCQEEIIQLISILCDNAIKYSSAEGDIRVNLYKQGKNVCLDCFNTCEYIDPETVDKLFDRFYRTDASRSRETGGYGIGLSVAKAIVARHKGKIKAVANGTTEITFKVIL